MDKLVLFTETDLKTLLVKRSGESKFGEHVKLLSNVTVIYDELKNLDVDYIIFGIQEEVGLFENQVNTGASGTWNTVLKVLLNKQSNRFTHAKKVLVLGHLDFSNYQNKLLKLDAFNKADIKTARKIVSKIDKVVTELVFKIIKAGKIPIVIGSGQNNSYGLIKGTSLALKNPINVLNVDPFTDLKTEVGRHNYNGFTYAKSEGFLNNYFILGADESEIPENILKIIDANHSINYISYDSIFIRKEYKFKQAINNGIDFIKNQYFGIEIDCNAIKEIPSTLQICNGLELNKVRVLLKEIRQQDKVAYLHISEALSEPDSGKEIGHQISHLITDFIKAHGS